MDKGPAVMAANAADSHHTVAGVMTPGLRLLGLCLAGVVLAGVGLGVWRMAGSAAPGQGAVVSGLLLAQVVFCGALVLLGSVVEGFGSGLSLGTRWPYTRNIFTLLLRGDPEAAHRLLATAVGLTAVALALLSPGTMSFVGLALIAATALLGMGTLYVLAGRAPALVHGLHGLLAYLVLLNYLVGIVRPDLGLPRYLDGTIALHSVLFAILLGGMVTGQRGFGQAIEPFLLPRRAPQWVFVVHGFAALLVIGTLGWLSAIYPVAFALALLQASAGFFLFHGVNLRPKAPGVIVMFHQSLALLITLAIVFRWH